MAIWYHGKLTELGNFVLGHFTTLFMLMIIKYRYMMYIRGPREVYFIDRDNAVCLIQYCVRVDFFTHFFHFIQVFQIDGLSFVSSRDRSRHLLDTLVDGEMVIDKAGGMQHPRYLIYDLVSLEGNQVMKENYTTRYRTIQVNLAFKLLFLEFY